MSQKSLTSKPPAEAVVRDIRRATRRHYSAEDKIRIVLEGGAGQGSASEAGGMPAEGCVASTALPSCVGVRLLPRRSVVECFETVGGLGYGGCGSPCWLKFKRLFGCDASAWSGWV